MDDVHVFTTADEFRLWLDKKAQAAHRGLHEHQADITYGSHWVRFVDLDAAVIEFGRVLTLAEVAAQVEGDGRDEDRASVQRVTDRMAVERDLIFAERHDRFLPHGNLGYVYRSHIWPVEDRLFQLASEVEFDYRKLGDTGRFLLDVAFRQMRAHVVGK